MMIKKTLFAGVAVACVLVGGNALAQVVFTKGQVADRIRKVEDGDEHEQNSGMAMASVRANRSASASRGRSAASRGKKR